MILPDEISVDAMVNKEGSLIAIIQAGGKSTRSMLSVPNQFVMVDEKPVIVYVLEAYEKHPKVDEIVVVCLSGWEKTISSYAQRYRIKKLKNIVTGGNTIIQSVNLGVEAIKGRVRPNDTIILQEATRPLISEGLISKIITAYKQFGDSVFVRPMTEYVQVEKYESNYKLCDRELLFSLESPEIYNADHLIKALAGIESGTDDGSCVAVMMNRLGIKINYCENTYNNPKIVRQEDLYYFKALRQVLL